MFTGIRVEGASPMARAFKEHRNNFVLDEDPETVVTVIRIGNFVNGRKALKAIYFTGDVVETVTDAEIISA